VKMAVFWVVAPYSLVDSEVLAASIIKVVITHCPDDGGSKHL
jgi:hypothetical protein